MTPLQTAILVGVVTWLVYMTWMYFMDVERG